MNQKIIRCKNEKKKQQQQQRIKNYHNHCTWQRARAIVIEISRGWKHSITTFAGASNGFHPKDTIKACLGTQRSKLRKKKLYLLESITRNIKSKWIIFFKHAVAPHSATETTIHRMMITLFFFVSLLHNKILELRLPFMVGHYVSLFFSAD